VQFLERLPGVTRGAAIPLAMSADGSVIVGQVTDDDYQPFPARWDNGALTVLTPLIVDGVPLLPIACSSDASIILARNGAALNPCGYWLDGGTVGRVLAPLPDGVAPVMRQKRNLSDDGTVICGSCMASQATFWTNGTPAPVSSDGLYTQTYAPGCSADGSILVAKSIHSDSFVLGYAQRSDLTFRPLAQSGIEQLDHPSPSGMLADGSTIYCSTNDHVLFYWNNLNEVDQDGNFGVINLVPTVTDFNNPVVAEDSTSTNPIIYCTMNGTPTKVTGTQSVSLPTLGGFGSVSACSGDGSIVVGIVADQAIYSPCYWQDAADTPLLFATPSGWTAQVEAISRSGSVAYGMAQQTVTIADPPMPPPPAPSLAMVSLYPSDPPGNVYTVSSSHNAEFPDTFGEFTFAMWCYKQVNLRWPDEAHMRQITSRWPDPNDPSGQPFGLLQIAPDRMMVEFRDAEHNLLFSGTFQNPNPPNDGFYLICFTIDIQAQNVLCLGDGLPWTSADALFASPGEISNIPGR